MSRFTAANYALILFAIFVHEPIGRRFGLRGGVTCALSGLCVSALVVACLANVCAGLIRPFVLLSVATGTVLAVRDALHGSAPRLPSSARMYIPLAAVAVGLFLLNDPEGVFLRTTEEGARSLLLFNRHYSYFSSLSTEMLNAEYLGRLRIANLYPQPWSAYHFFNASTLAVAQGLLSHPGLFSYFSAQACLMVLILLSFGEQMILASARVAAPLAVFLCWLASGFSVFHHSLTWNLGTSGAFSVFAMVQLLFALHAAQYSRAALFSFLLGASAIRLAPLGALAVCGLCAIHFDWRRKGLREVTWRAHWPLVAIAFLFCAYNALTVIAGKRVSAFFSAHWASGVFNDEWLSPLVAYKVLGYLSSFISGTPALPNFDVHGDFGRLSGHGPLSVLFVAFLALSLCALLLGSGAWPLRRSDRLGLPSAATLAAAAAAYFAVLFRLDRGVFLLNVVAAPYLVVGGVFAHGAFHVLDARPETAARDALRFVFLLFGGTLAYLYTGTTEGIKAPAAMAVFDIGLWGLLGLFAQTAGPRRARWLAAAFLAHLAFFDVRIGDALRTTQSEHHDAAVDVSPLLAPNFSRMDYVDRDGMGTFDFEDAFKSDVFSAVLGARLPLDVRHESFMNWRFLPAPPPAVR